MTTTDNRRCSPATAAPLADSRLESVRVRLAAALYDVTPPGPPLGRFNAVLTRVLDALEADTAASRSYLAESPSADAGVTARRVRFQAQLVARLVDIFDGRGGAGRFACQALGAAITTMAAESLAGYEPDPLPTLRRPLVIFAERSLC